jgi:hypothetical protein
MFYTEEQIAVLSSILSWYVNEGSGVFLEYMWYAKIRVYEQQTIFYRAILANQINHYIQPIYGFLHCTPLEEVPLYINTIPELARWRLMIAK